MRPSPEWESRISGRLLPSAGRQPFVCVCVVVVERSLCLLHLILCEVGGHRYLRDGKCSACFEVACDAQPFFFTSFGSTFGSTFPFSCHQAAIPVSEVLQAFLVVLSLYGSIFGYFGLLKESVEEIGRASCRERVPWQGWISVGAVSLKKKCRRTGGFRPSW